MYLEMQMVDRRLGLADQFVEDEVTLDRDDALSHENHDTRLALDHQDERVQALRWLLRGHAKCLQHRRRRLSQRARRSVSFRKEGQRNWWCRRSLPSDYLRWKILHSSYAGYPVQLLGRDRPDQKVQRSCHRKGFFKHCPGETV